MKRIVLLRDSLREGTLSSIPAAKQHVFTRSYPFGWLGILMQAPPSTNELIYADHELGFALVSTRSPELQRMYIQCDPNDDIAEWSDAMILEELQARLKTKDNWTLLVGPLIQKSILALRSFVIEPMAVWRVVSGRGCCPYRSTDRSERVESGSC